MSFHSPHLLWLLVPLVLLFSWDLARRVTHGASIFPKIVRAWAGAFDVSLGTRHTTIETRPRVWLWFGLALCIIALARPQWGVIEEKVFDQSREVLIAVDLSKSMLATDVKPTRLDRSKLLITSLLDGLKGERVGLVLFAGTAFLQSPLSADYEILREFLPALKPEYLPEGGSNYRAMLETSMQAFGTSTADRYLIILSDGESTEEGWKELGDQLKTKGIRVIGLGVGTAQGSFIPDGSDGFVKDERGAVVLSRLNSSTLQDLAQITGGAYTDASAWVDLADLLKTTVEAGRKGDFSEKNTARKIERFQWFLAPGLLLLFLSFWAEFPVRPRERALPLGGKARGQKTESRGRSRTAVTSVAALVFLSSVFNPPSSASAAEAPNADDTLSKPLTTTIARLAGQPELSAKDCSDLAQTTLTFGQRMKTGQQPPPAGVVQDALAAVDLGEKVDAKAADWSRLRKELQELLEKPPEQKDEQKKQDQKQNQQKQDQKNQQDKNQQDQKNQDQQQQQQDQQKSDQEKQQQEQQRQDQQDAFGDMKDQKEPPKSDEQKQPPLQPQPQTQKVGGQKEKKQEATLDPDLAMPLQKLDQVRNQDSPAKLQQLMQGRPAQAPKKGKDW